MRRILPILVGISVVFSAVIFFQDKKESKFLPVPGETLVLRKDDGGEEEEHRLRKEWIEKIHRAAPGVNWRELDKQTRLNRYAEFVASRQGGRSASDPVVILDGFLQGRWVEKGSNNLAGRTRFADYDTVTRKVYLVSDGGNVWKGNLDGSDWEVLNDQLQFESPSMIRVIRRNGGMRILVSTWDKFAYYSDDDGATWQQSQGFDDLTDWDQRLEKMVVADDESATVYALASSPGTNGSSQFLWIYRSLDMGTTFQRYQQIPGSQNASVNNADLWMPQYGYSDPYVIFNNKSFRVNTIDSSLVALSNIFPNGTGYSMLTGFLESTGNVRLYAYVNQVVYKSLDAGTTWEQTIDLGKDPFFKSSFSASITSPDILYFGDIECNRSQNAGQSFTRISEWFEYYDNIVNRLHADIPSVNCLLDENGEEFQLINTDGGTYYSNTNATIVENISLEGLNVSQYYSTLTAAYDTSILYVGSQDQGFQLSTSDNGGVLDLTQVISGDYGHIVSSNDGGSIWMVYPGFAIFYPNGTSNVSYTWDFDGNNSFWMPPLMADPDNETVCYLANGLRMMKLEFNGAGIDATQLPTLFLGGISSMAISPVDNNRWYVMTETGRFYQSMNRGETWTFSTVSGIPGANYLYGAHILPSTVNPDVVYICGSGYSNPPVFKSGDNGATFQPMNSGLPGTMVFRMAAAPNDEFIFAATEVGPYVYTPSDQQWHFIGGGFAPEQTYWWVEYVPQMKTARFASYGRGIWDFRIESPLSASLVEKNELAVYPNPAKDFFTIRGLDSGENGMVNVFGLDGKLKFQQKVSGSETINIPDHLTSGMYLVILNRKGKKPVASKLIVS
jgi:hypothetical protein